MPGNEFRDRVHNFFAQESSLQGQPQSQLVEGNWPALNHNFWVGSQRQADVVNLNGRNYYSQDSDIDRGQGSYPFHVTHGLNFTQPNLRADFGRSQSPNDLPNLNSYTHGNQFHPSRQNETNFLMVDTDSEQHHLVTSIGLSGHELQQGSVPEHLAKTSVRSETVVPSVSFDLFGGQQQKYHHQSSMLQPAHYQDLGINKQQQQQQQHQLMIRKMQDLQRQQQFQQLDLRQQNLINQVPIAKVASGSHSSSAMINGDTVSGSLQYPWATEAGTNWLNRGSLTMQGSPSGLVFPPNLGQTQLLVDMVPQQGDQSFYGVPVSSSRGLTANQYSDKATDRASMLQTSTSSNTLQGNHNLLTNQVGVQDGTSVSRQKFENIFGHASSQSVNAGTINMEGMQQVDSVQRNAPQDFLGRQKLTDRPETPNEKSMKQVVLSSNEAALDPDEEKILFGSDDNIWTAFGNAANMNGESGNLFDNGDLNGFPSIQSGSWSALMQSAVAEASSSDIGPQEEWSGLMFNNVDVSLANQSLSIRNDNVKQQLSLADGNMQMHSALSPGSIPLTDDTDTDDVIGSNLLGHKFQNEPDERLPNEVSRRCGSLVEASKWSNYSHLQNSVAGGLQMYGTSQHSLEAERNAMKISSPWAHAQGGVQQQSNGNNALAAAMPPGANRVLNIHEAESLSLNSQSNQLGVLQGEADHRNSLWKSNSVSSSAVQLDPGKSTIGNLESNKEILSLNHTSSASYSCSMGGADETSPFIQNSYVLNQWKNTNPSAISQGGENLGRMLHQVIEQNHGLESLNSCDKEEVLRHELENNDMKENSSDSHRSNLSCHTSTGYKETGLSDANDSRSVPPAKQKPTNHLSRKFSAPRKFQYHPMGNLDEDVDPSYRLKPNHVQAVPQKNSQFDLSNILVQFPRNSKVNEKGQSSDLQKHNKVSNEEPRHGGFAGYAPNMSVPFSRHFDLCTQDKASGQNMLELLPKVDKSRDHGAMMPLSSFECNVSTQVSEPAKFDGSANHHQRIQSPVNQGFGLQLGPPSFQRLQIPDHPQKAQETFNLMSIHAASEMGEKGQQMVPTSLGQSSRIPSGELQDEFKDNGSAVPLPRHAGNDKMHKHFQSALSSGSLHVNRQIDSSFSGNTQRGSADTVLPDVPGNIEKANLVKHSDMSQQVGHNDAHERGPSSAAFTRDLGRASHHFSVHDSSHQGQGGSINMLQNMGTSVPQNQHNLGVHYQKAVSQFSELTQPNIVESGTFLLSDGDKNVCKGVNVPSELSSSHASSPGVDGKDQRLKENFGPLSPSVKIDPVPKIEDTLAIASSKNPSNNSAVVFLSTQNKKDKMEDFGRSLKPNAFGRSLQPNTFSQQNYGLPDQMKDLKDSEIDPSSRASKRAKGPDNASDIDQVATMVGQQNEQCVISGDKLNSSNGVRTENSSIPSFSCSAETLQVRTSECENVASVEYPNVSPLMAPSWFNQYGTFKNGQILHQYDAHRETSSRSEVPFTLGKPLSAMDTINSEGKGTAAASVACQVGSTNKASIPTLVPNEHLSSHSSQLNATSQHPVILSSKKRKSATSDLHPWHKEISDGSQNLLTLSVVEAEWNKVTNRLPEKQVDYDAEFIEDGQPLFTSKRRLIFTTQLMQQLFRPPPANVLSTDTSSKYECVIYAVTRTVLGDACDVVSCSSGLNLPHDGVALHSAKGKPPERNGNRCSGKVIEELMGRSMKLENDFARLDKNSSIFDLRMECLDLDKFSIINRLAKFHGRGHADNAETAPTQKPLPQRYVAALPMPRNLPDSVQCLSLQ